MQGRRVYPDDDGRLEFAPGTYGRDPDGLWWVCTPSGYAGVLSAHTVDEHEDGTITVSPSILTPQQPGSERYWHGYLVRGEWKSC